MDVRSGSTELAEPCSFVDHLPAKMSDSDKAAIMGGNLGTIMRVPAAR